MTDNQQKTPAERRHPRMPNRKPASWTTYVFIGGLIGFVFGIGTAPSYSSLSGAELAATVRRNNLAYGGAGLLIGGAIGVAVFIVRQIRDSRK